MDVNWEINEFDVFPELCENECHLHNASDKPGREREQTVLTRNDVVGDDEDDNDAVDAGDDADVNDLSKTRSSIERRN